MNKPWDSVLLTEGGTSRWQRCYFPLQYRVPPHFPMMAVVKRADTWSSRFYTHLYRCHCWCLSRICFIRKVLTLYRKVKKILEIYFSLHLYINGHSHHFPIHLSMNEPAVRFSAFLYIHLIHANIRLVYVMPLPNSRPRNDPLRTSRPRP